MDHPGALGPRLLGAASGARRPAPLPRARKEGNPNWFHIARASLLGLLLTVALTLVLFVPGALTVQTAHLNAIATHTMFAPKDFSVSDPLATSKLRDEAAGAVPIQYRSIPGPLAQSLSEAASLFGGAQVLLGIPPGRGRGGADGVLALVRRSGGAISPAAARDLLSLSRPDLDQVQALVLDALAASAKRGLDATQAHALRLAPPFPISTLGSQARNVAAALFAAFLKPNQAADSALTAKARREAAARVTPVQVRYSEGQVIVRGGDLIDRNALAALQTSGLLNRDFSWQTLLGDFLLSLLTAGLLHGYLITSRGAILLRPRRLLLLDTLFLSACIAAAVVIQQHGSLPYTFPAAAISILLTLLLDFPLALVATALWAFLAGWELDGSILISGYFLVSGMTGAMLIRGTRRSTGFFVAGCGSAVAGLVCVAASRLLAHGSDWLGMGGDVAAIALSGLLAATLTLGSLAALGRLFGVTTTLHMLELSHPNHPLLRRLMQEAPGTYHHSLMIGTLAERAAEQIGADALLVRVIAYFHDIGKLVHPTNFAENQAAIGNIHDRIEPEDSVALILEHIYEGVRLARAHHLPEILEDGIWQHHGTNLVSFFYQQAVERRGEAGVRIEDFRYPGPRPQTREMAILMLADGVEAAVRASPGADAEQIRGIIHRLTQERVRDGQLDECPLTLRDLAAIEHSFAIVLQGISHGRVRYPRSPLPAVGNQ
ncbi:MAG TPA: HDIG domain-containing protein [Chloroflexota bacterium]|nr:HDIG domain-containing protein [Chloroflexota bacterium]